MLEYWLDASVCCWRSAILANLLKKNDKHELAKISLPELLYTAGGREREMLKRERRDLLTIPYSTVRSRDGALARSTDLGGPAPAA
jgi:hypothetical protein